MPTCVTSKSYSVFCIAAMLLFAGCEVAEPVLSASRAEVEFTATDESFPVDITFDSGELEWTASADQPWLILDTTSGMGNGSFNIMIDRSRLDPSGQSSGRVTVRAGEQEFVIEVNAVSAFTPVNTAYFPMEVGNTWSYSLSPFKGQFGGANASTLRLSVASRIEVSGFEAWQVDISLPDVITGVPLFKGATVDNLTGGSLSVATYWVFLDGAWYLGTSRESLDSLPATTTLYPLANLMQLPSTLAYLQASGLLETAGNQITGILAIAQQGVTDNSTALFEYLNAFASGDTADLFALSGAFGAEFSGYNSGDPVLDAFVELLADTATGIEPIYNFILSLEPILQSTLLAFYELQEPPISLAYWTAWEAEFGAYTNSDPTVQALVRLITTVVFELSVQFDAAQGFSQTEMEAYSQYLQDLFEAGEANSGLFLMDPAAFVDAMQAFATNYPSGGAAVQSATGATLRILNELESAIPVLEEFMAFPIDTAGVSTFIADATSFNDNYVAANGPDPAAAFVGVLLDGAAQLVSEITAVAPALNTIAADFDTYLMLAEAQLLVNFDLDRYVTLFSDMSTFFGGHADATGDALAEALMIYTQAASDTLAVVANIVEQAENAPYEDVAGTLSALLPDTPFPISIEAFGITDQVDCISPRILVDTEGETLHIASTIYARDIGPALLWFLPLQYGEVGGQNVGTQPAE